MSHRLWRYPVTRRPWRCPAPDRGGAGRLRRWAGLLLLAVPLLVALLGPALADADHPRGRPFDGGSAEHPLGTDFVGRDTLDQVLLGGRSVVAVAVAATLAAYLVGVPLGLLAALTRRRWLDEVLMRPLDLLVAVPSLLLLILLATTAPRSAVTLVVVVAVIALPEVARISRAAALPVAHGPAMEALRLHRETWWRRAVGHAGRGIARTLVADAGVRLVGALYLVATASFLGIGVAPDASDWAVMVDRNRAGLFLAPGAVVLPALLLVALAVGVNLLADQAFGAPEPATGTAAPPTGRAAPPTAAPPVTGRPPGVPAAPGAAAGAAPGVDPPLLRVVGLRVETAGRRLVDGVSFTLAAGQVLAIVGASGSGKTSTGRALLGEAGPGLRVSGSITLAGRAVGPGAAPPPGTVGHVPQQPASALNPVRRIGPVLHAVARRHLSPGGGRPARRAAARCAVRAVLARMSLPDDRAALRRFPHQLSGGQQQRLVIAHALLARARVLVADEPTTGQDAARRREVATELRALAGDGLAVVLLSHDLDLVRELADRVLVLHHGTVVESGPVAELFAAPRHAQTRHLLAGTGARTSSRPAAAAAPPAVAVGAAPLLTVTGLVAGYAAGARRRTVLHDVDLTLDASECLAVVGPSGGGKTTLARCLAGLHPPRAGAIRLGGRPLPSRLEGRDRADLAAVGYVFQDARASFQPDRTVLDQVTRAGVRLRRLPPEQARSVAADLLDRTGLPACTVDRRSDRLSGGELHRAALARALIAAPRLLICDEITAGLDAGNRALILDLLDRLRHDLGSALLVVTHDHAVVARLADRVLHLDEGRVVASGPAELLRTTTGALLPSSYGQESADHIPGGARPR